RLTRMFGLNSEKIESADVLERLKTTLQKTLDHFHAIMKGSKTVDHYHRISTLEKKQMLQVFNDTAKAYPKHLTILDLFEDQVQKTPAAVALISGQIKVTYEELDAASNQMAHYLRSKGVKEETMVPVFMSRSVEMVTGIMGILKAGGAYVPIDPDYPQERIQKIVQETGASLMLTDKLNHAKL